MANNYSASVALYTNTCSCFINYSAQEFWSNKKAGSPCMTLVSARSAGRMGKWLKSVVLNKSYWPICPIAFIHKDFSRFYRIMKCDKWWGVVVVEEVIQQSSFLAKIISIIAFLFFLTITLINAGCGLVLYFIMAFAIFFYFGLGSFLSPKDEELILTACIFGLAFGIVITFLLMVGRLFSNLFD